MTLRAYVMKIIATRILGAAAILLAVLQILDLLDVTTDILDRGLGVAGVIRYSALRLPRLMEQVLPLSVLAGGLFAFAQLARESAVIAMRSTGVSIYRLLGMVAPVALCVALLDYAVVEIIAPRTDPALESWWSETAPTPDKNPSARPFRAGADLVFAKAGDERGAVLTDVRIYRRDTEGRVVERIEAPRAIYAQRQWRLEQPKMVRFMGAEAMASSAAQLGWNTRLRPSDVQVLLSPDQTPSAANARRALSGGGSERPASFYAMRLQQAVAGPLAAVVMLLLTVPVALGNFRNREGAVLTTAALAAGLVFLVVDGLLVALGEGGMLSPVLAAWSAPLAFAALAATVLLRMEG
jgi:lipopolysaccharide export system permease protein